MRKQVLSNPRCGSFVRKGNHEVCTMCGVTWQLPPGQTPREAHDWYEILEVITLADYDRLLERISPRNYRDEDPMRVQVETYTKREDELENCDVPRGTTRHTVMNNGNVKITVVSDQHNTVEERYAAVVHEYGHHLSHCRSRRSPELLKAYKVAADKTQAPTERQKRIVLEEERLAWKLGKEFLVKEELALPERYDELAERCVRTYVEGMER